MEVSISQEDLDNSLVVLPPPPQELEAKNSYVKCSLSHHRTILTLLHLKLSGLVIRKQPQLLGCLDELDEARQSCMFIPAPSFNKILLFMNLEKVFDENAIDQIVKSIERQLELVNQNVMEVDVEQKSLSEKLEVQLLVCASNRLLNSEIFKRFEKILLFSTAVSGRFSNIKVGVMYSDKKSLERKIRFILNIPAPESSVIRNLKKYYIVKLQPIEDIYRLSLPTELETFVEESIHMFESNFPDRRKKLIIIPCLDKLKADELSAHYVDTKSDDSLSVSKKLFLPKLRGVCGILVQGFSSDHLRTIVDQDFLQPQKFEFDWVYLGNMHIVVLEVGIQRSHEQLLQTVKENIIKSLTRTIPNFNLVLYSLWKSFEQKSSLKVAKCSFRDVFEEIFHHIIYLPKVGHDTFIKTIKTIRESLSESGEARQNNATKDALFQHKFLKVVKMMKPASRIAFMLHSNWNSEPIIVQVDSGFNLVENCEKLEEELFSIVAAGSKKSRPTEMKQKFLAFASSLISTASLKFGDFDAQKRTAVSIREWKKLQKEQLLDFNLSQHQRRILSEPSNTHLLITGDAGSEKSALLLSKSEQMAKKGDVDKILLFYDHQGKFLRKYLEGLHEIKMLLRLKTNTLFEVRPIAEFDAAVANERNFNRTVLLIHELRSRTNIINWNIISYFKCSWITSFGIDGPSKSVISKFSRNFKRKHLKTSQETEGHLPSGKRHERVGDILHNESLSTEKTKEVTPHNSFKNAELRKDRTEAKSARKVLSTSEQNEQLSPEMDSMMVNFSNDFDKYNLGKPVSFQLIEGSGSYCEQNLCKDHNFEPNSTYESTQLTQTHSVDSSDKNNPNNDQEEESFYGSSVTCENRQHGDLDVLEEVTVWDNLLPSEMFTLQKTATNRYSSSVVLSETQSKTCNFEFRKDGGTVEKIRLHFPGYCILGTRKISVDFYFPTSIINLPGGETLLTPVVFITQSAHIPFLKKVIVTLPVDSRVPITDDTLEQMPRVHCRKKEIFIKGRYIEIHSFSFSPIGLVESKHYRDSKKWSTLRALNLGDQEFLHDNSTTYFTMKQMPKPRPDGKYVLRFDCRSFSEWQEFENHRCRENWDLHSLSQHSNFSDAQENGHIIVIIKENNSPISFDADIRPLRFRTQITSTGANGIGPEIPNRSKPSIIERYYRFNEIEQNFPQPHLLFSFADDQEIIFKVLNQEQLENLNPPISAGSVAEFISLLDDNWMMFIFSELEVPKHQFFDFVLMDALDSIEELLPPIANEPQNQNQVERGLLDLESRLLNVWHQLFERNAPGHSDNPESINTRVERKCIHVFRTLYDRDERTAKSTLLTALTQGQQTTLPDQNKLTQQNRLILAKNLLCMDYAELISKMKYVAVLEKLGHNMSNRLRECLGIEENIDTGDNLEESVEMSIATPHPGEV